MYVKREVEAQTAANTKGLCPLPVPLGASAQLPLFRNERFWEDPRKKSLDEMSSRSKRKGRSRRSLDGRLARKNVVHMAEEGGGGRGDRKNLPALPRTLFSPPLKPWAWTSNCGFGVAILTATAVMVALAVVGVTPAPRGEC